MKDIGERLNALHIEARQFSAARDAEGLERCRQEIKRMRQLLEEEERVLDQEQRLVEGMIHEQIAVSCDDELRDLIADDPASFAATLCRAELHRRAALQVGRVQ